MKQNIGRNIRMKRLEKGYKQENLAHECNMTQSNISQIENNKINLSNQLLERIAEILGTTVGYLKFGENEELVKKDDNLILDKIVLEYHQCLNMNISKEETIKAQSLTIELLKKEIDRLTKILDSKTL